MEITSEDIKATIQTPDKIMNCEYCGNCFYIKKITDKGDLLVYASKRAASFSDNEFEVECFGWIK